jgi:threonine dehydratase
MVTIADIWAARPVVAEVAVRTPLVRLRLPDAPAEIYLKLENLQPIGSFKLRGAHNTMRALPREELSRGVLTASAGNMAQGVAFGAQRLGIPCWVVVPDTAPETKIAAVKRMGGEVIPVPFDTWWETFSTRSYPGIDATFIHAFDDERVMAGNGTIGLEILEDLPDVDTVLIPFGGGGLACGIATALRALRPETKIYATEAANAAPLTPAFGAGEPVEIAYTPSFADGIAGKVVFPEMWARASALLDGAFTATEDEMKGAVRLLAERNRVIAEGAGACPVAVALSGKAGGGKIVCVVSGGNIDFRLLAEILSGQTAAHA